MALALNNAQGELHPLEIGVHGVGSGMQPKEYGDAIGAARTTVQDYYKAAKVALELETHMRLSDLRDYWRPLAELHSAPKWLWRSLVSRLVAEGWTVEQARRASQQIKDAPEPLAWVDAEKIGDALGRGELRADAVRRFAARVEQAETKPTAGQAARRAAGARDPRDRLGTSAAELPLAPCAAGGASLERAPAYEESHP